MTRIEQVFGVPRVLLPVVHPVNETTAMASVRVAVDAGCRGVFVINQGMSSEDVFRLIITIRREHSSLWVGLNLIGCEPADVLLRGLVACERLDGVWSDNARIDEQYGLLYAAARFMDVRKRVSWGGLYFGGVAFKYKRPVETSRLGEAAAIAVSFMDVVCTSGPGTGKAADLDKVRRMRAGMGPADALALASGITAENVASYLPYVDAYLVGTGIEHELGVLDSAKVERLRHLIEGA